MRASTSIIAYFQWGHALQFHTPWHKQKDASYVKLPAISGGQFPNDALLCRYKSAKDGGALISPQQPRISSSGQSSTGRLTLLDILSVSVGCNTLHLACKVVCKGRAPWPLLDKQIYTQEPLRPACSFTCSSIHTEQTPLFFYTLLGW